MSKEVFIVDGVRTAIGNFGGTLSPVRVDDLAATVLKALMDRHPNLDPKLVEEIIETPVYEADGVTQKIYRNKPKFDRVKSGEYIYEPDSKGNTFAVKHLGRTVKGAQIFNSEVFTTEILQAIDKVIGPIFQFPKTVSDQNELDEMMDADEDDEDVTGSHEKLFNQAETVAEVNQIAEEAATNEA